MGDLIGENKLGSLAILDLSCSPAEASALDNYTTDMLAGLLRGLESGNCRLLRRLVISGMCLEAEGCNHLRAVLKKRALPALQELLMAGGRWLRG